MRKVVLNVAVSIDMLIEGPNGEYDWCFDDGNDYGMKAFMDRIDAMFIGRKSYDLVVETSNDYFPGIHRYVFSNSLTQADQGEVINGDWVNKVKEIINSPGKDIWLFGGANLTEQFMNENLVDELQLAVHPIILGAGKPLFPSLEDRKNFKLKETIPYESGLVQLIYTKQE